METNYRLNSTGKNYVFSPPRDKHKRVSTSYFKDLILIYAFQIGYYIPDKFRNYVESLNILADADHERMPTRQYEEWKHNIDNAKKQLKGKGLLAPTQDGRFTVPSDKLEKAYERIAQFLEIIPLQFDPTKIAEAEYPVEKVKSETIRRIRDTALSRKVKEARQCQCQVCGTKLTIGNQGYAEAHHVKPLGHDGPDIESNMLVLCPNHHVLFDYGEIAIDPENPSNVINSAGEVIGVLKPPLPKVDYLQFHFMDIFKQF